MHTTAFWLTVPESVCVAMLAQGAPRRSTGCAAIGVALETVATLALMCDPRDLGDDARRRRADARRSADGAAAPPPRKVRGGPQPGYNPTLFLYEHVPGGIGLAERIFEQRDVLLARALRLIEGCPCPSGLPGVRRAGRRRRARARPWTCS